MDDTCFSAYIYLGHVASCPVLLQWAVARQYESGAGGTKGGSGSWELVSWEFSAILGAWNSLYWEDPTRRRIWRSRKSAPRQHQWQPAAGEVAKVQNKITTSVTEYCYLVGITLLRRGQKWYDFKLGEPTHQGLWEGILRLYLLFLKTDNSNKFKEVKYPSSWNTSFHQKLIAHKTSTDCL